MIKAQRVGSTIVAMFGGKMYQKTFSSVDERAKVYEFLLNADESNEEDVSEFKTVFAPELLEKEIQLKIEFEEAKKEAEKIQDILDFMKQVKEKGHKIFEVVGTTLQVKGINISVPELLVKEIIKAEEEQHEERLNALLRFWSLCALNPDPRARFDLFKFLHNHDLKLTNSGNFIAYRTVKIHQKGDLELEKFVTQEYLKVKRWKKSPKNYNIHNKSEGGYFIMGLSNTEHQGGLDKSFVGNLDELYQNIGTVSGTVYTDAHTRTFRIKMGEPVTIDRKDVDPDPKNPCSYGLNV